MLNRKIEFKKIKKEIITHKNDKNSNKKEIFLIKKIIKD